MIRYCAIEHPTVLKDVGECHQIGAKEAQFSPIDSEEEMF
jgi:hypothetical protein